MRLSALVREACRDVATGTTRFALFSTVLGVVICGLVCLDSLVIGRLIGAADTFRGSGGATLILTAEGRVDGESCERMADIPGVHAAGALRESSRRLTLSTLPGAPVPEYEVTSGFPRLLSATGGHRAGLVVSLDLARSLGVAPGDDVATSSGSVPIAATYPYPADGRRPGFAYAALSITAGREAFDECWVEAWPQITNLRAVLFTTLRPDSSDDHSDRPTLTQLNSALGREYPGGESFASRVTRGAVPLTFIVACLLGYVSIRMRRLQLASALHSGVRKRDLACLALLETVAWAIIATTTGIGAIAALTRLVPAADSVSLFVAELGVPLAGFAGAVAGALWATAATREGQLFRYVRER